jgi:hypothetical protein
MKQDFSAARWSKVRGKLTSPSHLAMVGASKGAIKMLLCDSSLLVGS